MQVKIYDTTLRDGSQSEEISLSVDDKLKIARKLDELGVSYVEGGWPGSNPKDVEFFQRARALHWHRARLAAFGSTCRPRGSAAEDPNLRALVEAGTPVVTIFGKAWRLHVEKALGVSLNENLELITASVSFLKSCGKEVIFDAEHFFDGYADNPTYALATLVAAESGGADVIVLCDTNGGTLPSRVSAAAAAARAQLGVELGIHTHNDSELAVANALAAVEAGATHVQGTVNGYGERCGNANLCALIPILECKLGREVIGPDRLRRLTAVSRYIAEVVNLPHRQEAAFVGRSAFAHKGGVHVSAVLKDPATYEHLVPELVGNTRRVLVSELSGKSNVVYRAAELGIKLDPQAASTQRLVEQLKRQEHQGFTFEGADGTFRLLLEEARGHYQPFFTLDSFRVYANEPGNGHQRCDATVRVTVGGRAHEASAHGRGPVLALDRALKRALKSSYPRVSELRLIDYKVRVLNAEKGTAARVRVLIDTSDGTETWTTIGVSENILNASWQALADGVNYMLFKTAADRHAAETPAGETEELSEAGYGWGV